MSCSALYSRIENSGSSLCLCCPWTFTTEVGCAGCFPSSSTANMSAQCAEPPTLLRNIRRRHSQGTLKRKLFCRPTHPPAGSDTLLTAPAALDPISRSGDFGIDFGNHMAPRVLSADLNLLQQHTYWQVGVAFVDVHPGLGSATNMLFAPKPSNCN